MSHGKKKQWINKKKSVTYELVNRPQRDDASSLASHPAALNPVKAYGQDIDDDELYSLLANRFNPHHEEDTAFDYFVDSTSDEEEIERKLTKPIGRAGGVFVTPEGDVLPSQKAWDEEFVEVPAEDEELAKEVARAKKLEESELANCDPDIADALENFEEGKYQQLADNFVAVAMNEDDKLVNVDDDIDVGGEYGLDELEGDNEAPVKSKKSASVVNTSTATSTRNASSGGQFSDAEEDDSGDDFHPLNQVAPTPKSVNVKQQATKLNTNASASKQPTNEKAAPPANQSQAVKPLSEIMKNLHIETKGNVLANFDYSAEEEELDDDAFEDADEDDLDVGAHPLDHVHRIVHLSSAASKAINKFGGDDFDSVLREFDDDEDEDEDGDVPSEVRHVLKESEFVEALDDFIEEKGTYQPLIVPRPVKPRPEEATPEEEKTESPAPVVGDKFGNTTTGSQSDSESSEEDIEQEMVNEMLEEMTELVEVERQSNKPQWDCDSIITTYSNTDNHPRLIATPKKELKIRLNTRGLPRMDQVIQPEPETEAQKSEKSGEESGEEEGEERENLGIKRNKKETAEEKRERKRAVKESRKEARLEKKQLKVDYRRETVKQRGENVSNMKNCAVLPL